MDAQGKVGLSAIVIIAVLMVIYYIIASELVEARNAAVEYQDHEVGRLADECQQCRDKEAENWQHAAQKRFDQVLECLNELDECKETMKLWHPAHISPHTKEACEGYTCFKEKIDDL